MPNNKILAVDDITNAIQKTQDYLKNTAPEALKIEATADNRYGQPNITLTLPDGFALNGACKNEVAAFARALFLQDPTLKISHVDYDDTGKPYFNIQTTQFMYVKPDYTNAQETAEWQPIADNYALRMQGALKHIANKPKDALIQAIDGQLQAELAQASHAYCLTRDATEKGFSEHKNVTVFANQLNDPAYTFRLHGAIDGSGDANSIVFGVGNGYINSVASNGSNHCYGDAIKQALKRKEKNQIEVLGNNVTAQETPAGYEQCTNKEKSILGHAYNAALYQHYDALEQTLQNSRTLTLMTDTPVMSRNAVILNATPSIANDPGRLNYYATRWCDENQDGTEHSKAALIKQFQAMNQPPNVDISAGGETMLYRPLAMERAMVEQAKLHYAAQALPASKQLFNHAPATQEQHAAPSQTIQLKKATLVLE